MAARSERGRCVPAPSEPARLTGVVGATGGARRWDGAAGSAAGLRLRSESRSEGAFSSSLSDVPSASSLGRRWRSGSRCSLPEIFDRAQLSLAELLARFCGLDLLCPSAYAFCSG